MHIGVFSTDTAFCCQHGPMLTSKILENRGPVGVRASLGRCWKAPGGSVALPGRSGEVAGGFGEVLVLGGPGAVPGGGDA